LEDYYKRSTYCNVHAQIVFNFILPRGLKIKIKLLPEILQTLSKPKDCSEFEIVRDCIKASRSFAFNFLHKMAALIQKILIQFMKPSKQYSFLDTFPLKILKPKQWHSAIFTIQACP
jgi:hypothetical protein